MKDVFNYLLTEEKYKLEAEYRKLEAEGGMESLSVDVGGRRPGEGGEEDVGAVRIVTRLLQCLSHHGVDRRDEAAFSRASASVYHHQWCLWKGEEVALRELWEDHQTLCVVEGQG